MSTPVKSAGLRKILALRQVPMVRYTAYIALWLAVFFAGAWPTWKAAYRNSDRIEAADAKIEALTSMAAAGAWFNAAAESWEPIQREEYGRFFPTEKAREELFLDVALMARDADIDPFELREIPIHIDTGTTADVDELSMTAEETELARLVEQFATDTHNLPSAELHTYRLQAVFEADYARISHFLDRLETIPRALTLHNLNAVSAEEKIRITMELDFYVQPAL